MSDDGQYFVSKKSGRLYVSRRFGGGDDMRFISEIVEGETDLHFATVEDEVVIRRTSKKKFEIRATVTEHDREFKGLTIQKWSVERGRAYDHTYFAFVGDEVRQLLDFAERARTVHLDGPSGKVVDVDKLVHVTLTPEQAKRLVSERQDLVIDVATHEITRQDIIALAYRKQELAHFERLLSDDVFFSSEGERTGKRDEALWQAFFERNSWIFGHGLSYAFMTELDGRKLGQVVKGFDLSGPGKRADAVLKTHAHLSSLAFVEIKRHDIDLLARRPYRPGVWAPSEDVSGGVAQCHEVVRAAGKALGDELRPKDESGDPTGEEIFQVHPRAFLVVGRLLEFESEHGPNTAKFRSFEAFRRNLHQPEILTYDELLYRARFIVDNQADAAARRECPRQVSNPDEPPL